MERLAKEEGVSRSELVRMTVRSYKRDRAEMELLELQRLIGARLKAAGITTEEDVGRFVFEDR